LGGTARKAKILRTGAAGSAVHGFYKSYVISKISNTKINQKKAICDVARKEHK
jgi:hypothetical protein